ncbi:Guanidinobutyrase [Drechslerella dactyloides]|uniref:Guanidinobutyrase n=1 Tax=Drechslerella dactyloides TaxID=74499 RepID=A0AAD6NLP0_DREDA|nr:Guanidinobutyrase [Drechslerella dactyloides]
MLLATLLSLLLQGLRWQFVDSHATHDPKSSPKDAARIDELKRKWTTDWAFSGISTFAHLPHTRCLVDLDQKYDIAIIGAPFDTAVSYRPGARFGPRAIRAASARQTSFRGFNHRAGFNPYENWATIIDCGDIPVIPFDNALALEQMTDALEELLSRNSNIYDSAATDAAKTLVKDKKVPKIVTLGGDHTVALAALRALNKYHGPLAVLHFDAHLDTWDPIKYPSAWSSDQVKLNHGSMFWLAQTAYDPPLIFPNASVHAGLRTRLSGVDFDDYHDDTRQGWYRIEADEIDDVGVQGVVAAILDNLGKELPVYLSVDIDVIDPGIAPGTGTPEPGGWTTREMIRILRGLEGLNLVGADIVEVAPAYDGPGEQTALAAAQIVFEILTSMVKQGVQEERDKMQSARGSRHLNVDEGKSESTAQAPIKDEL